MPRQHHDVVLSLGSNVGDRLAWLNQACAALTAWTGIRLIAESPVYETDPVNVPDEFSCVRFLNQIVLVKTTLDAHAFSFAVHAIEKRLGRARPAEQNQGHPRMIDIDIITFGELILDTPELALPHPRARLRRFVLQPLVDLLPDFVFPGDTRDISDLLRALPPIPSVNRFR